MTNPPAPFSAAPFSAGDYTTFRYVGFALDENTGEAEFHYRLSGSGSIDFVERVTFAIPDAADRLERAVDTAVVRRVLVLLGAVLGLSYYKAAAPSRYEIEPAGLTATGRDYLASAIRHGLAEFAYRNGLGALLEPEIVLLAPAAASAPSCTAESAGVRFHAPLVPIGGGKDSVVSVESLRAAGLDVTQFAVNPNTIIHRVAAASGLPFVSARRVIDPVLLELNARGALNGHVPVTAMNTLIALAQALLLGLGPVVMSNESSASDPTLDWGGDAVNHQWSKSLDAEMLLNGAIEAQTGVAGLSFSLLRPFSELRIARGFARITGYDHAIVSCNRAYRMGSPTPEWCGECPKCHFVFLALAPFMESERLTGIVGRNVLDDAAQLDGFRALLGLDAHKPFECVGEEAESSVAMSLVARSPEWRSSAVVQALLAEVPGLAAGDAALEASVFADSAAPALPSAVYEEARRAFE